MVLEILLKVILATSVAKLGTSSESVLCSKMKARITKNQEVTKRIEGTWYLAREIEKLLQTSLSKREIKKDKSLMLKYKSDEDSSDDDDMAYLISRFQKIVKKKQNV